MRASFDTLTKARKQAYKLVKEGVTEVTIRTRIGTRSIYLEENGVWEYCMMNPPVKITAKGTPSKRKEKKEW